MFRINYIEDNIRIRLMTSCEHDQLEQLSSSFEAVECEWPDVDACRCDFTAGKPHLNQLVHILVHVVFNAMDQGLI